MGSGGRLQQCLLTHLRAKRKGHSLHSYGLSPVCARKCLPTC